MHVDRAEPRYGEHRTRKDLPVRHHDQEIWSQLPQPFDRLRVTDPLGLVDGQAELDRGELHLAHPAWVAQAALVTDLDSFLLDNLGIDQAPDLLVVTLDDAHAQRHADLVGREPGPGGIEHGLGQIVEEALDGRVDTRDFLRLFAQDWLFEAEDRPDHELDSTRGV